MAAQEKQPSKKPVANLADARPDVTAKKAATHNFHAALARLAGKIRQVGEGAVLAWFITATPSKDYASLVCAEVWGADWNSTPSSWERSFMASRIMASTSPLRVRAAGDPVAINLRAREAVVYLAYMPRVAAWMLLPSFHEWFADEFQVSFWDASGVRAVEADSHNSAMHALNGNPHFSPTMDTVRAATPIVEMYEHPMLPERVQPWVTALELSTVDGSINPVDQDIPTTQPLRADYVSAANAITNGQQFEHPEEFSFARQARIGNAAPTNSPLRMPALVFGTMSYASSPLEPTSLAASIEESALRANMNLARADNTTLGGFLANEVAVVSRMKSYYGLSLVAGIMKLLSLSLITSLAQSRSKLPMGMETQKSDPYTVIDPANLPNALTYNTSPVFGEACGGNASVLPWRAGDTGQLAFHLSLDTVPPGQRPNAIFLPSNLITAAGGNTALAVFLFVSFWADWPTVLWVARIPTRDRAGGNGAAQPYVPHLAVNLIPGETTLDIILPRNAAQINPTAQLAANALAAVQPTFGSLASALYGAGNPLNINFRGGGYTQYNLAEYCYTWSSDASPTNIAMFLQRLNDLVDISDDIHFAIDNLACTGIMYQPMTTQQTINIPGDVVQGYITTALGVKPVQTTVDWPQTTIPRPDHTIPSMDIVGWNQVCLGVRTVASRPGTGAALPRFVGAPFGLYWLMLIARTFAVTTNVHRGFLGLTAATWNRAFANTDMISLRELVRMHYSGTVAGGLIPRPALMSHRIARLHSAIHRFSPAPDFNGNTVYSYIAYPRNPEISTVYDPAGAPMDVVPVFLPDVWIHQTARFVPKCFCSFPPPSSEQAPVGLNGPDYSILRAGPGSYGPFLKHERQRIALAQTETRDDEDGEIWNARLVHLLNPLAIVTNLAAVPFVGFPNAGQRVYPQVRPGDYTTPNLTGQGVRTCSTLWIPSTGSGGILLFLTDVYANMLAVSKVQSGQARGAIEMWLINGIVFQMDMVSGPEGPLKGLWAKLTATATMLSTEGGVIPVPGVGSVQESGAGPSGAS